MKEGFRQSMAWLHTWSGLLVCWILLLVFCAGTASYYRNEITLWMQPELHGAAASQVSTEEAAKVAQKAMQERATGATRWFISLPGERNPATQLGWSKPSQPGEKKRGRRGNFHSEKADPATGEVLSKPRETRGGEFLYRLHFDLHYMPAIWARWIVGFCAMFMFVSIISGIVTHKRIFKDLFTFRPKKGQRSWLDAHNVTAVLALPYHIMITYTGLVTVELPGRFQVLPGRPSVILDVAHNPHAAAALNQNLGNMGFHPYTYAVFGSMHDKDIDGVLAAMSEHVDHWCLAGLPSPRAATASELAAKVQIMLEDKPDSSEHTVSIFDDPAQAFANAMSRAGENDRIVVFGSFLTVAGVMKARKSSLH